MPTEMDRLLSNRSSLEACTPQPSPRRAEDAQMRTVAGVDACRIGGQAAWVAVVLARGAFARAHVAVSLRALLGDLDDAQVIGVDMPIGLPRGKKPRLCDLAAREFVGARRSSVFLAPPAKILGAPSHAEASDLAQRLTGRRISLQAYGLRKRILEVAPLARRDERLIEVHPEVSFCAIQGRHLEHPKLGWAGQEQRRGLLADAGISIPSDIGEAGGVPAADVLDAAAAAWSADGYARGKAKPLPAGATGRNAVIWC